MRRRSGRVGMGVIDVLKGNEGPRVEPCGLLLLQCTCCGAGVQRWRPIRFCREAADVVRALGVRCRVCAGSVRAVILDECVRVPEGDVC
jgi:hypothetical protein